MPEVGVSRLLPSAPQGGVTLSARLAAAVEYAREVHGGHVRKGTAIPYVSHLLAVATLVLESGGDEDEAVAALLHDAVEDGGGKPRAEEIRCQFGRRVARIVLACSDSDAIDPSQKRPWRERKERHLAQLPHKERDELRVSLADKVHNARAILLDLDSGISPWDRFNAGPEDQLWYYRSLAEAFAIHAAGPLAAELSRLVDRIEAHVHGGTGRPRSAAGTTVAA